MEEKEPVAEYSIADGLVTYYFVTFLDEDETTVLCQHQWPEGAMPSCGTPYKESNTSYSYAFSHWSPNVVNVTEDAVYVAVYQATPLIITGYEQLTGHETPVKLMNDGKLLILMPDGRKYNALGQEVR